MSAHFNRRFRCKICPRDFSQRHSLNDHIRRIHGKVEEVQRATQHGAEQIAVPVGQTATLGPNLQSLSSTQSASQARVSRIVGVKCISKVIQTSNL